MKNKPIITITVTIIFLISIITPSLTLNPDGILLLSFKYSILEDPLHVLDSWSYYDDNPCSWRGIECNSFSLGYDNPRVVQVSLPQCQLLGSLPVNFGLLEHLQILNLSSNSINGSIPDSLCSLPDIHVLDLSNNLISGELLESIGGLRSLEVVDVSENALAGNIPRNLGTLKNLSTVFLKGNYFSGEIPGGLDGVQFLDLSLNLLNGSLPVDFVGEEIKTFNISYNRF